MNYTEWANEYLETAERFNDMIIRLKDRRKRTDDFIAKLNMDYNISRYRLSSDECIKTAQSLFKKAEEHGE